MVYSPYQFMVMTGGWFIVVLTCFNHINYDLWIFLIDGRDIQLVHVIQETSPTGAPHRGLTWWVQFFLSPGHFLGFFGIGEVMMV
jgi:hypothetical protein